MEEGNILVWPSRPLAAAAGLCTGAAITLSFVTCLQGRRTPLYDLGGLLQGVGGLLLSFGRYHLEGGEGNKSGRLI